MKKHPIFLILVLFSLLLGSCKYDYILPEVVVPVNDVKFATQVVPIFEAKCLGCHQTQLPVLSADVAYSNLVPAYVDTADAESSEIYTVPKSGAHYATYSATEAARILQWITEGANNN